MLNDRPSVSVTICCYNSEQYIEQTVQSVLDQTFDDFGLIVVNDGSSDRTEEIVKGFSDARIHYEFQENRGLAATRNRTLELARGEYVAFLDHDDLWAPEKLERQMALFQGRPEVGLVYSDSHLILGNGERFDSYFNHHGYEPCRGRILDQLIIQGCMMPLPSVVVRKSALTAAGGFNPAYNILEDYDAWLRIAADYSVDFVPDPLCSYRCHSMRTSELRKEQALGEMVRLRSEWQGRPDISPEANAGFDRHYVNYLADHFNGLLQEGRKRDALRLAFRAAAGEFKCLFWPFHPDWSPRGVMRRASQGMRLVQSRLTQI